MKNNVELNIDLIIEEYSHYVFTIIYNLAGNKLSYQDIEEIIDTTNNLDSNEKTVSTTMNDELESAIDTYQDYEDDYSEYDDYDQYLSNRQRSNKRNKKSRKGNSDFSDF